MSKYECYETMFSDRDCLVNAIRAAGYTQVEVHEEPVHLRGYMNDKRPEKAEIVIRKEDISRASNDVGFRRREDGTYEAIVSEYDKRLSRWVESEKKIRKEYAREAALKTLKDKGYENIQVEKTKDGKYRITAKVPPHRIRAKKQTVGMGVKK